MIDQEQPVIQNSNSNNSNNYCSLFVLIYFCLIVLILIIFVIFVIAAIQQNSDQAQIKTMGALLITMSIISGLAFVFYIFQLKAYYQNQKNSKYRQYSYELENIPTENDCTCFCTRQEQMKFLPIHYFFLIFAFAYIFLIVKLMPTTKTNCQDYEYDEGELTPSNCTKIYYDPEYQGPMLEGLAKFSILIGSIIFSIEFILFFSYCASNASCPISYKQQYIQKVQRQAKKSLILFLIYSIFKIILYIAILSYYKNPHSVILIAFNIYFHLIMILAIFRSYYLVGRSKKGFYDNFYNYMTLISQIYGEDKINKVLNLFIFFSLPFIIMGGVQFEKIENEEDIINTDYFVYFDCFAVQIFVIMEIFCIYLIRPQYCVHYSQKEQKQDKQVQVGKNRKVIKKPYIYVTKDFQNVSQCAICLQVLKLTTIQSLGRMRCHKTHIFHTQCIDEWLKNHNKCPICNASAKRS